MCWLSLLRIPIFLALSNWSRKWKVCSLWVTSSIFRLEFAYFFSSLHFLIGRSLNKNWVFQIIGFIWGLTLIGYLPSRFLHHPLSFKYFILKNRIDSKFFSFYMESSHRLRWSHSMIIFLWWPSLRIPLHFSFLCLFCRWASANTFE